MKLSMQKFVWGGVITAATLAVASPATAQDSATVLLLDRNAIQANLAPNFMPAVDINVNIADVGVRDALPFFNIRPGQQLTLPGGTTGHEGWFAIAAVPAPWVPNADTDGLENFLYAGPGLGSPDATGSRITLLGTRPEVVPLGPSGLQQLAGRTICAVAYSGELPRSTAGVTLSGPTLGILAYSVDAVAGGGGSTLPSVVVTVRETRQVCGGALAPMADAPAAGM